MARKKPTPGQVDIFGGEIEQVIIETPPVLDVWGLMARAFGVMVPCEMPEGLPARAIYVFCPECATRYRPDTWPKCQWCGFWDPGRGW